MQNSTPTSAILNRINLKKKYTKYLLLFGMLATFTLALSYLMILNSLATRGFHLETVKIERLTIMKENEALDIELAIPNSLYALESDETFQNMEIVKKKHYIEIPRTEESVAFLQKKSY